MIILTITIEGDWVPESFEGPRLQSAPGMKVYEAKLLTENCTPVKRVYQQTAVPQESFCTSIPALTLTLFDTPSRSYKTLTAGPFPITYHPEHAPRQDVYKPKTNAAEAQIQSVVAPPAPAPWLSKVWARLTRPHEVILHGSSDVTVRLAPAESSQALFSLKPGTAVNVETAEGNWIRISCPNGIGWIPKPESL